MTPTVSSFTETCPKSYDRHDYKIVLKNGKAVTFDDYEMMRAHWFQWSQLKTLSHVNVLDKSKKSKGFKWLK